MEDKADNIHNKSSLIEKKWPENFKRIGIKFSSSDYGFCQTIFQE